ncbi:MAG: AAA family ATPase [Myxococcota bacterium]
MEHGAIRRAPTEEETRKAAEIYRRVQVEIAKVYVGRETTVELLLIALFARGHVLLEGVPGIAKTTLVKAFAQTLGCAFSRIQFTPDLLPADITGTNVLSLKDNAFSLRKGPLFSQVVLGDEINRAPAKTQSALLEAMQENQVTIEGTTEPLPSPFIVLATQNPIEQEGVYALPEAQVDRFTFRMTLEYPDFAQERRILDTYNEPVANVEQVLASADILEFANSAEGVHIAADLLDYIVRLVQETRHHASVLLGASPRASLGLMACAKVRALLMGRGHVLPDDLRALAHPILCHRLILTPEAELDRVSVTGIVDDILTRVPYASGG